MLDIIVDVINGGEISIMKNIKKAVLLSSMALIFAVTSGCSEKAKIQTVSATSTPASSTASVSTMAPESTPEVTIIPETIKPAENVDEAFQTAVKNDVENFVRNAYNSFYTINSIQLTTSEYSVKNNVLSTQVHVSLNKTLKAKTAEEIPYVKGMINKLNKLKAANDSAVTAAEKIINAKINDLSEYIGTATDQNDFFRITVKVINGELDLKNAKLEFANVNDWIPATAFIPDTEATMMQNGENDLTAALPARNNISAKDTDSIVYDNTKNNFTLKIPKSWEGKYNVVENEGGLRFVYNGNKTGTLFFISIWTKEGWSKDGAELAKNIHISKIGEKGDKIFTLSTPTDVQVDPKDKELAAEYESMWKDIESIKATFKFK
jgi:hypothetical protein